MVGGYARWSEDGPFGSAVRDATGQAVRSEPTTHVTHCCTGCDGQMHPFGETDSLQRSAGTLDGQKLGLLGRLCATPRGKPFEASQPRTLPIAALVAMDTCIPLVRLTVSNGWRVRSMVRRWALRVGRARRHGASRSKRANHTRYPLLHWLQWTNASLW